MAKIIEFPRIERPVVPEQNSECQCDDCLRMQVEEPNLWRWLKMHILGEENV